MRALIVDDSNFIRQYLRQMLLSLGCACEEAENGTDALRVLHEERERFDFMLVDVNMPVMGGMECVKLLRRNDSFEAMKVMMVTTEADNSFVSEALNYGADEFLMKPFTPQSLREKLMMMGFVHE